MPAGEHTERIAGKYELLELAGRGGMATVWRGVTHGEAGFTRQVAVKRVLPELSRDEEFAAMFVEEARVIAELAHPNIVQVHDFGRDHWGSYFIVMEWVQGLSMADYVHSFTVVEALAPWHYVAAMCIEVLRALSAAHGRSDPWGRKLPIIHRDVTPANILLGLNGVVKLTDFGLARASDRPAMTKPGIVKGKVAYMAPELLSGSVADPSTDLYSVGVVLWEALAGQRMFGSGTDLELASRVLKQPVPPLGDFRRDLPSDLIEVTHRLLARDREVRFKGADAAARAIANILRAYDEPTDAWCIARSVRAARQRLQTPAGSP